MTTKGQLVVVPGWLTQIFSTYGRPMTDLLDLNKLREYLSSEDITSYVSLNIKFSNPGMFGSDDMSANYLFKEFVPYKDSFEQIDLIKNTIELNQEEMENNTNRLSNFLSNIQAESFVNLEGEKSELNSWFTAMLSQPFNPVEKNINNYVIKLFFIKDNIFGLTLLPNTDLITNPQLESCERNIELILNYYLYEDVCQMPIFHHWCRLINTSISI